MLPIALDITVYTAVNSSIYTVCECFSPEVSLFSFYREILQGRQRSRNNVFSFAQGLPESSLKPNCQINITKQQREEVSVC